MSILSLLTTTNIPERRWFILFQDYLIFALLFVSGPVGLFVNRWTGHSLSCAPVLDCAEKPNATDCANTTAKRIVREIPMPMTTYLSDSCMEHTNLPSYVLYAYVPLFFGAVAVWLLHKLWLLLPPYSRIAKLYGGLNREKRRQIPARVLTAVRNKGSDQEETRTDKRTTGTHTGEDQVPMSSSKVRSTDGNESQTLPPTPETQVTVASGDSDGCSACIPSCKREYNHLPPGVTEERLDDRIQNIDADLTTEVSPRERKVIDALVHLLYNRCRPKFHRFVLLLDFLTIALCCSGGFSTIFCVIRVESKPVKCTVTDLPLNRAELEYTSISCVIHNEVGARTLYVSCIICAFAIALIKVSTFGYYMFTICFGCFKRKGNDCTYCLERKYCCGKKCRSEGCWPDCCLCCGATCCYSFCLQWQCKCCSPCEQDADMDAEMLCRLLDVNDLDIDEEENPVTADVQNTETQPSDKMAQFVMNVVNNALPVPNPDSDNIEKEIQRRLAEAYRRDMLSILDRAVPDKERVKERIVTAYRSDLEDALGSDDQNPPPNADDIRQRIVTAHRLDWDELINRNDAPESGEMNDLIRSCINQTIREVFSEMSGPEPGPPGREPEYVPPGREERTHSPTENENDEWPTHIIPIGNSFRRHLSSQLP